MKKSLRMCLVLMMCLVLSMGVGFSVDLPGYSRTVSTVMTIEAKQKINKKFKKAMDEYVKFYKKYCKFMKKYKNSSNTFSMLADYSDMVKQQTKVDKAFNKWKKKNLNSAELDYYMKINKKVLKLLSNL